MTIRRGDRERPLFVPQVVLRIDAHDGDLTV
jgi:hypothetical protein